MSGEPFSHLIRVADIPAAGRRVRLEADAEERRALAELLGIPAVEALSADIDLRPLAGRALTLRGALEATVVQTDVVTLDPLTQRVAEAIEVTLMPAEPRPGRPRGGPRAAGALVDAAEADGPELFHNGRIDLGVIVREHLALGLDPYPRAPGVDFPGHIEDDADLAPSPFAVLAGRTDRPK